MAPSTAPAPSARHARDLPLSNYKMSERSLHGDFGIRDERTALPNPAAHRHEYLQIHVQLAGVTQHAIGDARRAVTPGTVCFILPYKTHFIPTVPGSRYYILNASLGYLLPSLDVDALDLQDLPIERAPELAPFRFQEQLDFRLDGATLAQVESLCREIAAEDARRASGSAILIRAYLLQLIGLVWREYGEALAALAAMPASGQARNPALARLRAFLKDRLDQPVSLTDAAAAIHLSPTYLAHLLKRETGQTFVEYLTARRMSLARELLLHTSLSVKEIAFRCGFSDEAYFGRRFRLLEQASPTAFRRQLRQHGPC
jgi:AraC-like DNA-binding protein